MRRSSLLLIVLLAMQAAIALPPPPHALVGDEPYYVAKATQLAMHGRFDRETPAQHAVDRGETWGTSDWRPPGYAAVLALAGAGRVDTATLRTRMAVVQFAAIAAVLLAAFALIGRLAPLPIAILLGLAPWPFEFVTSLYPDALTAALSFFCVVLLWRKRFFIGALLLGATLLLRPEMIAVAFAVIALAVVLEGLTWRRFAAAAAAFGIVCAVQYAYRIDVSGERFPPFFGGFHTESLGAMHWVNTWIGSEHEALDDIVYAIADGHEPRIPPRAIASPQERAAIDGALAILRRTHRNSAEVDGIFAALARERVRRMPVRAWLLPRIAHIGQLWINLNTNAQTLTLLARVPRLIRLAILGALFLLKCAIVAAFCLASVLIARRRRASLLALLAAFVILRTLLIAGIANTMEHRYADVAWPALLTCACATPGWRRSPDPDRPS